MVRQETGAAGLRATGVWSQDRSSRPARGLRTALAAALAALALVPGLACGGGERGPDIDWQVRVTPDPHRVGEARLFVELHDPQGQPVEGAALHVEATMSHAGMVPEFADALEVAPGNYEASFEFTMGGDWILLLDATTADGTEHHFEQDVPGVSSKRSSEG